MVRKKECPRFIPRETEPAPEATSESNALLGAVQDDLYFALRERDLWMKQCLDAEAKVSAYEDVFTNCMPVNKEFKSNYSPSMIRLRWQLDQPTELDRAVRARGVSV